MRHKNVHYICVYSAYVNMHNKNQVLFYCAGLIKDVLQKYDISCCWAVWLEWYPSGQLDILLGLVNWLLHSDVGGVSHEYYNSQGNAVPSA